MSPVPITKQAEISRDAVAATQEKYVLCEAEAALLAPHKQDIAAVEAKIAVVVDSIYRAHKLEGAWAFDSNTNTFTRQP